MLFINFVCLLYLMLLIDGYTISKNIAYTSTDDIVDILNDLEDRKEYRPRHERLNYRREEREESRTTREDKKASSKAAVKAATLVRDSAIAKVATKIEKSVSRTTKGRIGFWSKFRNKLGHKNDRIYRYQNDVYEKRALPGRYRNKQHVVKNKKNQRLNIDDNSSRKFANDLDRKEHAFTNKRKRDVYTASTKAVRSKNVTSRGFNTSRSTSKLDPLIKFTTVKTYEPVSVSDDLTKALTDLTTRVTDLKQAYGINKLQTNQFSTYTTKYKELSKSLPKVTSDLVTTAATTDDVDFLGTAQIEALLNDIKVKAVQMVAEQIPAITDIITNTVTETTFEADPLLTHMSISTPGYALSTFLSIDGPYSKRTAVNINATPTVNDTVVITNTEPTHQIHGRSITEDVLTISQTVEDALQKSVKKLINKVHGKLSTQYHKEVKEVKTTIKKKMETVLKDLKTTPQHSPTAVTQPMKTPTKKKNKSKDHVTAKQRRAPKYNKKVFKQTTSKSTQSTFDDYLMLTLFEQILAKTHEDNVMKMLSTTETFVDAGADNLRLVKRTPKPTSSVKDIENFYEDIMPADLLNYGSKTASTATTYSTDPTEFGAEDTSYEGLSNKICFNDYVNGYKHYLKFQKEQGHQNFSNLVKYQAHRHHNVDDIGKYILDKIPQLPTRRRKRFFDEDVIDDQDISTKSDDSWFKKHFYMFIDNGPPKKFHTSQTVELKSPITEANFELGGTENRVGPVVANDKSSDDDSIENSLENLSKSLDDQKSKQFSNVMPIQVQISTTEPKNNPNKVDATESLFRGFGSLKLVDKIFGKEKTPKRNAYKDRNDFEMEREKRSPKGQVDENNMVDIEKAQINTLRSTVPVRSNNNGYVDVNLIPRPTAIVKLRENKQKKGKLKKFLNKFRFRKRKKNKEAKKQERNKRQYRIQRFDPLKKLKEIFKVKTPDKPVRDNYEIPDYEMMTSHIDTFKPVKYNKVPTIDELKGQIPNITEERNANIAKQNQLISSERKNAQKQVSFDVPLEYPMPEVDENTPATIFKETSPSYTVSAGRSKATARKYISTTNSKKLAKFRPIEKTSPASDVNDFKYDSTTDDYFKNYDSLDYNMSPPGLSSLDDIRSEINSLQKKLSIEPWSTAKISSAISPSKLPHYHVTNRKMYVPPHLQAMNLKPKAENKDLKIQTQLTRIAKFPLSHFHLKANPIEASSINSNQKTSLLYRLKRAKVHPKSNIKKRLNTYVTVTQKYAPVSLYNDYAKVDRYKPFPDYFNDLLMWHGDLLNTEKVTVPQWENVLDSIRKESEVTTLSMTDMQRELMHLNDFLGTYDAASVPISTAKVGVREKFPTKVKKDKTVGDDKLFEDPNKDERDYFKTVAVKDNTMAQTNDIIIQGQAKYFHFMKQPDSNREKYIQATNLLNNLNKMYYKAPLSKYSIDEKVRATKRDGEFWATNTESKNMKAKDQESSILYLDTTLLAYDDGPDFLTDRPKHKKMSKTSLKPNFLSTPTSPKPVAKSNPSPSQYFSTPLPMKMNDFERFLKDNQLDVQSVTTPIMALPHLINQMPKTDAGVKQKDSNSELQSSTQKTTVTETISADTEDYTKKLVDDAIKRFMITARSYDLKDVDGNKGNKIYKQNNDKRKRRYSELLNDRFFTFEPFRKKAKSNKVKNKTKFFDKKLTPVTDLYTVPPVSTNSSDIQNEVELTIINMNDLDQNTPKKRPSPSRSEKVKGEKPKSTTRLTTETTDQSTVEVTSITPIIQRIHNNLLYHHGHKDADKITNTTEKVVEAFLDRAVTKDFTTMFHPFVDEELFRKLQAKQHPKRVRISSHNYKYDIIYNNEPERWSKNAVRQSRKKNRDVKYTSGYHNDEYKPPYNSDWPVPFCLQTISDFDRSCKVIKIVRAIEAIDNYTRPNVLIHIDLPTYYMPETGPSTDPITTTAKSSWNDCILKRLSGIALFELLSKSDLLKAFDGKMNFTDGVDKAVNASKVFSIAEKSAHGRNMIWSKNKRNSRQATISPTAGDDGVETGMPNWREKRRLKLFSNIKGKLKTLLRKPQSTTAIQQSTKEETPKAVTKPDLKEKPDINKRQKKYETENDGLVTINYDFDIDKIINKVPAFGEEAKERKDNEMTTNANKKAEAEPLLNDEFPEIKPLSVPEIVKGSTKSSLDIQKEHKEITNQFPETPLKGSNTDTTWTEKSVKSDSSKDKLTTTTKIAALTTQKVPKKTKKKPHHSSEEIYFDPMLQQKQEIYFEPGTTKISDQKSTLQPDVPHKKTRPSETKLEKRDLQNRASYTAKDVAALEVIVDLVKNPSSFEEQDAIQAFTERLYQNQVTSTPLPTTPMNSSSIGTNSIQVHIAIPYNLNVDKKRSIDPLRVRRVFAAKMFTPVDLEYQVQSFDDSTSPKYTSSDVPGEILGPKMYLLIDTNGSLASSKFTLQPVKGRIDLSNIRIRQADNLKILTQKIETTSSGKNLGKVTLSKNFVAAINKHLVQLYENLAAVNDSSIRHNVKVRSSHYEDPIEMIGDVHGYRRHINWESVKKYFGHDRVCHCKCKPNKTMCRACAASDAVITELIFEFDNLSKYMNDHCTEIQTFFWMNPSGGKKLRDSVHKVDRTLHDYYKRVRGKCKGRTCNTFSTCIDKRSIVRKKKRPRKYVGDPLIVDMQILANDIETASRLNICLPNKVLEEGEVMLNTIGGCIRNERKATSTTVAKKEAIKNMYSLDNINVNIICKPDSNVVSSSTNDYPASTISSLISTALHYLPSNHNSLDAYDFDSEIKVNKKRKGLFRSFAKKKFKKMKNYKFNDLFTYYVTKDPDVTQITRMFEKRQAAGQLESPLISDSNAAFWHDHWKGNSLYSRLLTSLGRTKVSSTSAMSIADDVSKVSTSTSSSKKESATTNTMNHPKRHIYQRDVNATDYSSMDTLTHNINELFKIFRNLTDLKEIESISRQYSTETEKMLPEFVTEPMKTSTELVTESIEANETSHHKHMSKPKHKTKTTCIFKTIKNKLHFKHKHNITKTNKDISVTEPKTTSIMRETINTEVTSTTPTAVDKEENSSTTVGSNRVDSSSITTPIVSQKNVQSTPITTTTTKLAASTTVKKNTEVETSQTATLIKSTCTTKEASPTTKKVTEDATVASKDEQTSTLEPASNTLDSVSESTEVTTRVNFFNKIKTATINFLHSKIHTFHKETTTEPADEVRKSRSPATEYSNMNLMEQGTETTADNTKPIVIEATDTTEDNDNNPTILIINEYDSDTEPHLASFDDNLNKANTDKVDAFSKANKEKEEHSRNLLLNVLNFEAKKLNSEWKRYKKESQFKKMYSEVVTPNSKRNIFGLQLSSKPTATSKQEVDYDILKTLKELKDVQIPTPKGLDQAEKMESSRGGLLRKIASKFGVKVVGTAEPEKPLQSTTVTRPQPTQAVEQPRLQIVTVTKKRPTTVKPNLAKPTTKVKDKTTTEVKKMDHKLTSTEAKKKLKHNGKTKPMSKLKPKYSIMSHSTSTTKVTTTLRKLSIEAVDSKPGKRICDIGATFKHVQGIQKTLPKKDFERYITNLHCFKYKNIPKVFVIRNHLHKTPHRKMKKWRKIAVTDRNLKWDWIRNKRSIDIHKDIDTLSNDYYNRVSKKHPNLIENSLASVIKRETYNGISDNELSKVTIINKDESNANELEMVSKATLKTEKYADPKRTTIIQENKENTYDIQEIVAGKPNGRINDDLENEFDAKKTINKQNSFEVTIQGNARTEKTDDAKLSIDDETLFNDVHFVMDENEYFEAFVKDEFGIYRSRKKRHNKPLTGILQLAAGLKELPFSHKQNETYSMLGDSVIIYCAVSRRSQEPVRWETDRSQMLEFDNVAVKGARVFIEHVEPKNLGVYTCQRGDSKKSMRLTVITLPTFKVVITPVYSLKQRCVYDDLKALQSLGSVMTKEFCSEDRHCSVAVEEPLCLEDRIDGSTYIRATAVLTLTPHDGVATEARCRRDLHNSLALLTATDAPVLASIRVVISNGGLNKSLVPTWSARTRKAIVTHTLRKKDAARRDNRYHVDLAPGTVGFVTLCPAGYYLVSAQKICVACPIGSLSQSEMNACSSSSDESNDQFLGNRLRRCQWLWYPAYGYYIVWWVVAFGCAGVAALTHSRRPSSEERVQETHMSARGGGEKVAARSRPLSPSRVILAKFFRGSRSYTRATDSQETKFGLWKELHSPPPLPPIDFD